MIRRFVVLMLLAWLPIQASAMPWLAFRCEQHDSSGKHEGTAQQAAHGHHHAATADHEPADRDSGSLSNAHPCCHHFSSALHTLSIFTGVATALPVVANPTARLHDFIPDLPQRPPLAHLV